MSNSTSIKVALDWTPNTIHSGLFVAVSKGFYSAADLAVELISPGPDYTRTPAKLLEAGEVDLAICPSESCIAYNETQRMRLQAIYAILQKDASAIVSTKPEFTNIAALDKGVYGSYNAKYEDHIVRAMLEAGKSEGKGQNMQIKNSVGKLSLFEEMKKGTVDATWIFLPWEGVEAELEGTKLNVFKTEDYGIPYGYSPVIARNADGQLAEDALRRFVKATREGYEYAVAHPDEAAKCLLDECRPHRSMEFLVKSQKAVNEYYTDGALVGAMQHEKWKTWVGWLKQQGLLQADIKLSDVFTSEFSS